MKAIRLLGMGVVMAGMAAGLVQAQGPGALQEPSRERTEPPALGVVLSTNIATSPIGILPTYVPQNQAPPPAAPSQDGQSSLPDAPAPQASSAAPDSPDDQVGKQSKRILGIIPNFRAVSAKTYLPPLNFKSELWLATQDTFDYSSIIFVGGLAGLSMASKSQPTFGQGAEGFGKYYWHTFVDGGIENYMTEAIVPVATKEDPRYYTMGEGGFFKRTGYAITRLIVTRTNSGNNTFNFSEIVGAGAAAGIGNAYYPKESNTWVKTYQRWGTQVGLDGVFDVVKEFWPDINRVIFRGKY